MMLILLFGFLFGAFLQHANLNKYNTIAGMATLENLTVAKTIAFAIGLGAILINLEISLGFASYHVKPLLLGGVILGGIIFGAGMAVSSLVFAVFVFGGLLVTGRLFYTAQR